MATALRNWTTDSELPDPDAAASRAIVLAELSSALFASLPRSDQRRKGMEYVQGLLGVEGRKSIRNISTLFGGEAAEQSLHHFISGSTWDWAPVRRALAQHLERISPTRAYVLSPLVIPKAGDSSVGVDRRFCPARGQMMNAQQAVGVWAVSEEWSTPVNWRLHLPDAWLDDEARRRQASIPDTVLPETLDQCSVEAYVGISKGWGLPTRPVIMDAREMDVVATVRRLRAAGAPMLLRVGAGIGLTVTDPGMPRTGTSLTGHQIMQMARPLRHPVIQREPGQDGAVRTGLAATVRVELPSRPGLARRPARDMVLLGVGESGGRWPSELWLTDMTQAHPAQLMRLTRLARRVEGDFAKIADQVGLRDFSGRSFSGWHRHATLASAAHAVAVLSGTAERILAQPEVRASA
ncbi:IS701 family transposase [Streptomyces sp. NPDC051956]|uniref:IS701 family transposase n=1 Tax=Streptomyces sp. NPDC051956 TaxID=3365677 RepID=UPI0037D6526B